MIEVQGLAKRFRLAGRKADASARERDPREQGEWFQAVREVSFRCEPGEVLGLLGPNGAGKTTTLRLLSSALKPDTGSIHVEGVDVLKDPIAARQLIGFLSGSTGLYGRLTVRENVEYFGRLHGLGDAALKARVDGLFERLGMHDFAHKRADVLSAGMRQKCAIARAVVHEPRVVILDEPTTGLDVMAAKVLLDFIAEHKSRRIPLIFSTHHLHEVEKLCERVCIINQGRAVFGGDLEAMRSSGGSADLHDAFVNIIERRA
ncbi:MAG: ATP-binding cassette domain-containing protein [Gammaproteobacteria bacterium]|nr:ATP-binding cassette domain-containing protein [Gammaproteobacteria bacterium]